MAAIICGHFVFAAPASSAPRDAAANLYRFIASDPHLVESLPLFVPISTIRKL
jgi:hypothetical protein